MIQDLLDAVTEQIDVNKAEIFRLNMIKYHLDSLLHWQNSTEATRDNWIVYYTHKLSEYGVTIPNE